MGSKDLARGSQDIARESHVLARSSQNIVTGTQDLAAAFNAVSELDVHIILAKLLALTSDAVLIFDSVGRIVMANEEAHQLFIHPDAGLMGLDVRTLFPPAVGVAPQGSFSASSLPFLLDGSPTTVTTQDVRGGLSFINVRGISLGQPSCATILLAHRALNSQQAEREHDRLVDELSRANRRLSGTLKIVLDTLDSGDVVSLFERVLEEITSTMEATGTIFYVAETDGYHLRGLSQSLKGKHIARYIPQGRLLERLASRSGHALRLRVLTPGKEELRAGRLQMRDVIDEETREVYHIAAQALPPFTSFIAVPVWFGNNLISLIEVGWERSHVTRNDDAELLDAVAQYLSVQLIGAFSALRAQREQHLNETATLIREHLMSGGDPNRDAVRLAVSEAADELDARLVLLRQIHKPSDVVPGISFELVDSASQESEGTLVRGDVGDDGDGEVRAGAETATGTKSAEAASGFEVETKATAGTASGAEAGRNSAALVDDNVKEGATEDVAQLDSQQVTPSTRQQVLLGDFVADFPDLGMRVLPDELDVLDEESADRSTVHAVTFDSQLGKWLARIGEPSVGALLDVGEISGVRRAGLVLRTADAEPLDVLELAFLERVAQDARDLSLGDEARRQDQRIAQALQTGMRNELQKVAGISAQGIYSSATKAAVIGGDFYDLVRLPNDTACVIMGDVSGKGVEAASVSAAVKTALGAYAWQGLSPARMVRLLNEFLLGFSMLETFATLFVGIVDLKNATLSYCSAGHPPALLVNTQTVEMETLNVQSGVVGAFHEMKYKNGRIALHAGDLLMLYTDGTTEARSRDGSFFGDDGLRDALMKEVPRGFDGLLDRLLQTLDRFTDRNLDDDVAMVCLRFDDVGIKR